MKNGTRKMKVDAALIPVLSKRLEAIAVEMSNTLLRSARSGVINLARDLSCSIVTGDGRLLFVMEGLPVFVANMDLVVRSCLELFGDDIHEGDCFLNNSPYHGNTHPADHTHIAPVFVEGELMFFVVARGHQADIGNSIPTTYMPYPKDIYEEGAIYWPAVRVQKDYRDIEDVIRIGKIRIRIPEQWYGDYLAGVGACRIGEQRLKELCAKYGNNAIKTFIERYMEYGETSVIAEIRKLPKAHIEYQTLHDPVPGVADRGIPVRIKADIDPDQGYVYFDVTDNIASVPGGMNLSQATTRAMAIHGFLSSVDPDIPHNDGTFKRLIVKMAENKVVGYSSPPVCMSCATTNVLDRLAIASLTMFAQLGQEYGIAEHAPLMPVAASVIYGRDFRTGKLYCNQLLAGLGGGGAMHGYDGFLTQDVPGDAGVTGIDSVEIDEQKYPIMFKCRTIIKDSGGPGRWRGAPGKRVELIQRGERGQWSYINDGHFNPPLGIHGGMSGARSDAWKYGIENIGELWASDSKKAERKVEIPQIGTIWLEAEREVIVSEACGGGGCGDPLDRDPERVRWDAREEYISPDAARDIYGVVLDTEPELYKVDFEATKELRSRMKNMRKEVN